MIMSKMKHWIAWGWTVVLLIHGCLLPAVALGGESMETTSGVSDIAVAEEATPSYGIAGIEDGAIYSMQNVGSGLWASTSVNTVSYFYIWNTFQHSVWDNTAQTFRFVKTDSGDNTYLIYPLEYNNYNANGSRVLYCNYNSIITNQATTVNVTYAPYSAQKANCCEWIVEQKDGYVHTIRLKADPRYILCAIGDTAGNEGSSTTGNIVVQRQTTATSTPNSYQKWNLKFVMNDGTFHIKNVVNGKYMVAYGGEGSTVSASLFQGVDEQKFHLVHHQNGQYLIYNHDDDYCLTIHEGQIFNGDFVSLYAAVTEPVVPTRQLWTFDRLEDGTFQIQNVAVETAGYDYRLVIQYDSLVLNGSYDESINSSYAWKLFEVTSEAFVNTYYDKGYYVFYNQTENAAKSKIDSYTRAVAETYLEIFGVSIEIPSATYFESCIDQCKGTVTSANINSLCNCTGITAPHTRQDVFFDDFVWRTQEGYRRASVMWSGHRLNKLQNYADGTTGLIDGNRSFYHNSHIMMISRYGALERDEESYTTLLHEMAHRFSALDHYHELDLENGLCKNRGHCFKCDGVGEEWCLMNEHQNGAVFCDTCTRTIQHYLDQYH